jgi:hypothetical protein
MVIIGIGLIVLGIILMIMSIHHFKDDSIGVSITELRNVAFVLFSAALIIAGIALIV